MKRSDDFNYIISQLTALEKELSARAQLNLLDLHNHSEGFFCELLNKIFDWNLEDANKYIRNMPGIDLIDTKNKIVAQVTATSTAEKVQNSLNKLNSTQFDSYKFIFVSISIDKVGSLRKRQFNSPNSIFFKPEEDIFDISSLLAQIKGLNVEKIKQIKHIVEENLGNKHNFFDADNIGIALDDSELANIVNILSKGPATQTLSSTSIQPYKIDNKIRHNQIRFTEDLIKYHAPYYDRIDNLYREFDQEGLSDRKTAIFSKLKMFYLESVLQTQNNNLNSDSTFYELLTRTMNFVRKSPNYRICSDEALTLYVGIIVVHAFIDCKIFEEPPEITSLVEVNDVITN